MRRQHNSETEIYGDNLSFEELEKWYKEEEYGYANLGYIDSETSFYPYHQMNRKYGWKYTYGRKFNKALSIGGAFAEEFAPVVDCINEIHVVEPAEKFYREVVQGKPAFYRKPTITGELPYEDELFGLITCFGVLHHIPNVSYVFSELVRVLEKGGLMLIREPVISMGDWTKHRPGLTKNERGIPLKSLNGLLTKHNLELVSLKLIGFSPLVALSSKLRIPYWGNKLLLNVDHLLSEFTRFNYRYHRTTLLQKFGPSSAYLVVRKV